MALHQGVDLYVEGMLTVEPAKTAEQGAPSSQDYQPGCCPTVWGIAAPGLGRFGFLLITVGRYGSGPSGCRLFGWILGATGIKVIARIFRVRHDGTRVGRGRKRLGLSRRVHYEQDVGKPDPCLMRRWAYLYGLYFPAAAEPSVVKDPLLYRVLISL